MPHTHYAFSDDSKHQHGRFNSLALLTIKKADCLDLENRIKTILSQSGIGREFKWQKLDNARYGFAAAKLIDFTFSNLDKMRIDVIIWDLEDPRHKGVIGRDDTQNMIRMYYHLVSVTLSKRWPINDVCWGWFPDKQAGVDWSLLRDCLTSKKHAQEKSLFWHSSEYSRVNIRDINPVESHHQPFVQMADLFAGIGAYSWGHYHKYEQWIKKDILPLPFVGMQNEIVYSNSEEERFTIIKKLNDNSKISRMRISLRGSKGFKTMTPKTRINFWPYCPQGNYDKAPRRLYG